MKKIEVLAPVGNRECLTAAIQAGCDAVYLGGLMFGARNFAGNFTIEELTEAVTYAHLYGVKVYVTVNTLVYENEIPTLLEYVDQLVRIPVDALIIQDIGVLDLIHQTYPDLELHASTQMHIHSLEGVQFAEKLGCSRAVIAREVDIDTIRLIKQHTKLELEVFVHGALCISYSGQCLMSSLIGGRSGNRGTCAGTCRQKYSLIKKGSGKDQVVTDEAYLLSAKDLSTIARLGELIEAGVDSFKIEGRMKRPSYVYAVVSLYRKAIFQYQTTGKITISPSEMQTLMKLFHRGYTEGFLFHEQNDQITNPVRPNHMGVPIGKVVATSGTFTTIRLTDSVAIHDGIRVLGDPDVGTVLNVFSKDQKKVKEAKAGEIISLTLPEVVRVGSLVVKTTDAREIAAIEQEIKAENRKVPVWGHLEVIVGSEVKFTLRDDEHTVTVTSLEKVSVAHKRPVTVEDLRSKISRFGDSIYRLVDCTIDVSPNSFIAMSSMNELRRAAITALNQQRLYRSPMLKREYQRTVPNYQEDEQLAISIETMEHYQQIKERPVSIIYVNETLYQQVKHDPRVVLRLSRVMTTYPVTSDSVLVGEVGSLNISPSFITDTSLNVVNSYSLALLHSLGARRVTLSYELTALQTEELLKSYQARYQALPNVEVVSYGHPEMMLSKFLLPAKYHVSPDHLYLQDRFHQQYPIRVEDQLMIIYFHTARSVKPASWYSQLGIKTIRLQLLETNDLLAISDYFAKS